jgi:hypothetical protein
METQIEEVKSILQSYFEDEGYFLLVECDLCHDFFSLYQIKISFDGHFYCEKCNS